MQPTISHARRRARRHLMPIAAAIMAFCCGVPARADLADGPWVVWQPALSAPLGRSEAQGAVVGGRLYLLGGFVTDDLLATTRADVYSPLSGTWAAIADLPEPLTHAATAVDGDSIYLIGGYLGDNPGPAVTSVWIYDTGVGRWRAGTPLPAPRGGGGAAIVGRQLHFFGGAYRRGGTREAADSADHWVLDLDAAAGWRAAAPMPGPRNHIGSAALNGLIYAIGGQYGEDEASSNQSRVDVYDPAGDRWRAAADMPLARGHIGASVFTMGQRIITMGGTVNGGKNGRPSADVFAYDVPSDTWVRLPPLPEPRKTPVAGAIGGLLLICTGDRGGPTALAWGAVLPDRWEPAAPPPAAIGAVAGGVIGGRAYLVGEGSPATLAYDLAADSWAEADSLARRPFPAAAHAAEVFAGRLYLFGGAGPAQGRVQIYDPAGDRWSAGAPMPFAAGASTATRIGDQIYLAGGSVGGHASRLAARYDPQADTWAAIAAMPLAASHSAAGSDGQRLYVFGGSGDGGPRDSVQIYDPRAGRWLSSTDAGGTIAPLPVARSQIGRAVYAAGAFFLIGGAAPAGVTTATSGRVDIYDPVANSWRRGEGMPSPRQGSFPLLIADRVYLAGGASQAAAAPTAILDIYNIALPEPSGTPWPPEPAQTQRMFLPLLVRN